MIALGRAHSKKTAPALNALELPFSTKQAVGYLTTDWKSEEVSKVANWLSEEEYEMVRVPEFESMVVWSSAVFSSGLP